MLLSTHYQLLLLAIKNNDKFTIQNNLILFNGQEIPKSDIENMIKGLFYPDLPCSYFFIKDKHIDMKIRLCGVLKLASLGKDVKNNMRSQIEESHNGRFSINHSMSDHHDKTNGEIRNNILARCIIVLFVFLETKDFSFLGYLLHIMQDSYSPVHTFREELNKIDNKNYTIQEIIQNFKIIKQITPTIDFKNINHEVVSDLIYHVLDDKNNIPIILSVLQSMPSDNNNPGKTNMSNLINKIIELILIKCPDINAQINVLNILLGYPDGKISNSFIKKPFSEEKVSPKKINPSLLEKNKIKIDKLNELKNKVLVDNIIYDDLSHNLRRVYKLLMNSLFNDDVLQKISKIQKGGDIKRKYIKSFLFYPHQDKDKHAIKDCGYIQLDNYQSIFYYAFQDTKFIVNFCFDAIFNNNTTPITNLITEMYNFLMNNTFYMSLDDIKDKVSLANKDKIEFKNSHKDFIKCMKENVVMGVSGFNIKFNKFFSDLNSKNTNLILKRTEELNSSDMSKNSEKYKYKYKYLKYKNKYILLKNKLAATNNISCDLSS